MVLPLFMIPAKYGRFLHHLSKAMLDNGNFKIFINRIHLNMYCVIVTKHDYFCQVEHSYKKMFSIITERGHNGFYIRAHKRGPMLKLKPAGLG